MNEESKIVKNMGYSSYYVKKMSTMKNLKKRRKYLYKLVCNYTKFHNINCNIKSRYCKNIQYGGSKEATQLVNQIAESIKNLKIQKKRLEELNKIEKLQHREEKENLKKETRKLEGLKKFKIENAKLITDMENMKLKLNDLEQKDNLSISKIKNLENTFIDFTINQILFLKSIILPVYEEYCKYNDLNRLLVLMRERAYANTTNIAKSMENNERLDFDDEKNYINLQESVNSFNWAICTLFNKTGILIPSDITPIITNKKHLGWLDNANSKIVYMDKLSLKTEEAKKVKYTIIPQKEINIENFDEISKHIIDFDTARDNLHKNDLQKIEMIIDEGLSILMNNCSCDTPCTYQWEGKVKHWCKLYQKDKCVRGVQGTWSGNSKTCNPKKHLGATINMTEKSKRTKTKQYYIGSYPYASNINSNDNVKEYCLYNNNTKKIVLLNGISNKEICAKNFITVKQLLENRYMNVHLKNLEEAKKNINKAIEDIKIKKIN